MLFQKHTLLFVVIGFYFIRDTSSELTLREHIIGGWRELDSLTPHETHHCSRIMTTYHTHFGVFLRIAPG